MTKKLLGQCAACNLEKPEERYRYISNYALEKALIGTAYKICCPEIKVGTLLCNSCYCAIVEHNRNKKYKKKRKIEQEYQKFVENSKLVEELKIKIQETKIQLEIVTKPISADNNTFVYFFNDKIQRLATVLYNHQHCEENKPVLDVDEFTDLIESCDPNLCGFFNLIFQSMNPNAKGRQTKESLKRKVMLLCYQMAALRNKQVSGTKNVIGLYMAGIGTSTVGINTLSNMDLSATYQTVYNNKKQIANQQKLLILNIDDYHDLHESHIPSVTSINRISHMATILLNTNNISPIPLSSAFHNPNGIDINLLKQALNLQYMTGFSISYNTQKSNWSSIKDITTLNEFDLVETLVVHCYNADLSEKHVRRFDTTKLVDFIPSDLKNMNDYIKALTKVFSLFEMQLYLMNYIIPVPADFPGQLYIRRAIVQKLKYGNQCSIPKEVLSLVPILGPLHVLLNTRESCFLTFHPFFNELYKEVFGKKKNLAAKPKPWRINLLLYLAHAGWNTIKSYIFAQFKHSKDLGYCTFVDLLDNLIPATLDIYTILFRGNNFNQYIETIFRLWTVMRRFGQKNYDKIMLALISDVQYWTSIQHPIINTLRNNLWINDNQFAQSFAPKRSYPYTKKNLDLMTKRTAIFLLQFFEKLWINHGKAEKKMEGARIKKPYYYFPPLSKRFPFGAIPLGYHSSHLPNQNKFCDYENCDFIFNTNGIVLICGHAYHEECFDRIGLKCQYCFDYLSASIDELTHSFNEWLKMNIDIENEFDQMHVLSSEDDNSLDQAEIIKENNDMDRELADKITGIN
ncbi:hypothetical protein Glove_82g91 [Diversispora epigaea]|uniref:RING-type domain-containing protein n=1 Tax=Diversispora epigaea TaxID=1348612 RepID=A0A397JEI8_9GLOM|nr:hypothetical protein Glove_82g91 [Diversispora epigaea]